MNYLLFSYWPWTSKAARRPVKRTFALSSLKTKHLNQFEQFLANLQTPCQNSGFPGEYCSTTTATLSLGLLPPPKFSHRSSIIGGSLYCSMLYCSMDHCIWVTYYQHLTALPVINTPNFFFSLNFMYNAILQPYFNHPKMQKSNVFLHSFTCNKHTLMWCSASKGGTLQLWVFFDIDENIQKIIEKTIRIFDPFSIVKFECLDKFWWMKLEKKSWKKSSYYLKGHWTTSASSPNFFQKSWDFYIIRSLYLCSDCMLNLTCSFNSVTKMYAFFFQ